jgi:hypothetical protein
MLNYIFNFWQVLTGTTPEAVIITRILRVNKLDWPHRVYNDINEDPEADAAEKFMAENGLYTDLPIAELLRLEKTLTPPLDPTDFVPN